MEKMTCRRQCGDTASNDGEEFVELIKGKVIIVILVISLEKLVNILQMSRRHRHLEFKVGQDEQRALLVLLYMPSSLSRSP